MKTTIFRKLFPYLILILGAIYGLWPIDAIPDIPVIGWIDDFGVMGTAILFAVRLFSKNKLKEKNKIN